MARLGAERYDDVYGAHAQPETSWPTDHALVHEPLNDEERERYKVTYEALHSFVVFTDPPDHTRLRKIFSKAFTPKAVQTMRSITEDMVKWHLDTVAASARSIDLNAEFAYPLPANVISTIIGARPEDLDKLQIGRRPSPRCCSRAWATTRGWTGRRTRWSNSRLYLKVLYDERVDNPRDDMMSWLMEVQRTDPFLTEDDVLHSCIILLNAGHETTQTLICNTLTTLLAPARPDRFPAQGPAGHEDRHRGGPALQRPAQGHDAGWPARTWRCRASR